MRPDSLKQSFTTYKKQQDQYFRIAQPHLKAANSHYTLKLTKRLASSINLNSHDHILEVGCGSGRFTFPLLHQNSNLKITGLDFSEKLLKELNTLKLRNVKTLLGDVDEINKLTKEKFNKIIGFYILHHLPDLENSLKSLRKVTKGGTQVAFVEPNPLNLLYYPQPFISKNMSWHEEKGFMKLKKKFLEEQFKKAGYKDLKIHKFGFFPPFIMNRKWGIILDNTLEKSPIKTFLPFQLITATIP